MRWFFDILIRMKPNVLPVLPVLILLALPLSPAGADSGPRISFVEHSFPLSGKKGDGTVRIYHSQARNPDGVFESVAVISIRTEDGPSLVYLRAHTANFPGMLWVRPVDFDGDGLSGFIIGEEDTGFSHTNTRVSILRLTRSPERGPVVQTVFQEGFEDISEKDVKRAPAEGDGVFRIQIRDRTFRVGRGTASGSGPDRGEHPDPIGDCVNPGCHAGFSSIRRPHAPVRERRCAGCHIRTSSRHPEGSGPEFATAVGGIAALGLCLSCHESLAEKIRKAAAIHAPVAEGRCGVCHDPHGTDFPKLFTKAAWEGEWEPSYGPPVVVKVTRLCWQCHDRKMVFEVRSTTATRFRDGDRNLHHLHVEYRKHRECKACHEPHAGNRDVLFRESVPFGSAGQKLPIRVTLTENGGSCVVGCHRPRDYDRSRGAGETRDGK